MLTTHLPQVNLRTRQTKGDPPHQQHCSTIGGLSHCTQSDLALNDPGGSGGCHPGRHLHPKDQRNRGYPCALRGGGPCTDILGEKRRGGGLAGPPLLWSPRPRRQRCWKIFLKAKSSCVKGTAQNFASNSGRGGGLVGWLVVRHGYGDQWRPPTRRSRRADLCRVHRRGCACLYFPMTALLTAGPGVVHLLRPTRLCRCSPSARLHSRIWAPSWHPTHCLPGKGTTLYWVTGRVLAPLHRATPRIQKAARCSSNGLRRRAPAPLLQPHDHSFRVSNPGQRHSQPGALTTRLWSPSHQLGHAGPGSGCPARSRWPPCSTTCLLASSPSL